MKKILCVFLSLLIMCVVLCSCGKNDDGDITPLTSVASIGEENVTYALYRATFEASLEYMQQLGYNPLASMTELESFQDWILDLLITDIVTLHNAKLEGFTLSEEERAELETTSEEELKSIYDECMGYAEDEYKADSSKTVDEYFNEQIALISEYYVGEAMSFEQYSELYFTELEKTFIIESYKEHVCSDFIVKEADIVEWYSNAYDSDSELYEKSPEQYKIDQEYFEMYFGIESDAYPPVTVPEGYSRIMDIMITPEGELSEVYTDKLERQQEIYAECTLLMFNDAVTGVDTNQQQIQELIAEYQQLDAECQILYDEFTAEAMEKMNAAYAELQGGASFASVMLKYTEDPDVIGDDDFAGCEAFREKGKIISLTHKSSSDWGTTVKDIFATLSVGEYSEIFADDDGNLHIIYHASDITPGEVGLESLIEPISEIAKVESDEVAWLELVETWKDDPNLVLNMVAIRSLGASEVNSDDDN